MPDQKNRLILGCMNFGAEASQGARVTTAEDVRQLLSYLKARGYTELDTARIYGGGQSEAVLAAAGYAALALSVATKIYPTVPGLHFPDKLRAKLAESLAALRADAVDTFYLHAADRAVSFARTLRAVDDLYRAGTFRRFGLSNFASYEVAEIVVLCRERGWVVPSVYQGMYNPLTRAIEKELVPCCRRYGLDIVAYNPLAGGLLTDRYGSGSEGVPAEGRFSNTFAVQGSLYRSRYMTAAHLAALDMLRDAAAKHGITLVQLAMRWLVHHSALRMRSRGGNDGIIVGVSSVDQLSENIDAFEQGPLDDECVAAVDRAWVETERVTTSYWRGSLEYAYDTLAKENQ